MHKLFKYILFSFFLLFKFIIQITIPDDPTLQRENIEVVFSDNQYKISGLLTGICIESFLKAEEGRSVPRLRGTVVSLKQFQVCVIGTLSTNFF